MQTNPETLPETLPEPHPPATAFCDAARQVLADPERHAGRPMIRRFAWMILMAERGRSCNQTRIAMMQSGRAA